MKALIGHTGFVGSNLASQLSFDCKYNSKNIAEISGKSFDLLVCSGAPAAKWIANQKPVEDLDNLKSLMSKLDKVASKQTVLISTIDVYPRPIDVDEDSKVEFETNHAYGKNRYILEDFFRSRFDATIIRLPGLFGAGLKKNAIYDFIHNNRLDLIHQDGVFQFYDLKNLSADIEKALNLNIKLLNITSEPISVKEVASHCFGFDFKNTLPAPGPRYDYKSKHASSWGGKNGYLYSKQTVLDEMKQFVTMERANVQK